MRADGYSLPEMLFAMALMGVLLSGGMRLLPVLLLQNQQLLSQMQLHEELQQIMFTLEKAVRRAGYCHGQCKGEGLQVSQNGQCMLIKWDENHNGRWEGTGEAQSEYYGYRLRHSALEMQRGVSSCEGRGWERISDPDEIKITLFRIKREGDTIKLQLGGAMTRFASRQIMLEHWVKGINLS